VVRRGYKVELVVVFVASFWFGLFTGADVAHEQLERKILISEEVKINGVKHEVRRSADDGED